MTLPPHAAPAIATRAPAEGVGIVAAARAHPEPSSAATSAVSVGRRGTRRRARGIRRRPPRRTRARRRLGDASRDRPRRRQVVFARAHLERERSLSRLRQELVRREPLADLGGQTETVEPAGGEHDRVEPALPALPQAGVDVAAQRLDREVRLEREQLRPPPDRGGADAHSRPQRFGAAQRVARILARKVRADDEPFGVGRRHVLRRVHGDVDAACEQSLLELLHEHAARADLAEGPRAVAVAGRRDRHERDLDGRDAEAAPRRSRPA